MELEINTQEDKTPTADSEDRKVVIIGAGPAGLTAASELSKAGIESVVLEKDSVVGGISLSLIHI